MRSRLRVLALVLVGNVLLGACSEQVGEPRQLHMDDRPNILVIVTDDQRAEGTLGVMPETRRWFRRSGTTFTRAYSTTPLCCPARASIFSGRYVHNHGVTNNALAPKLDQDLTMQRVLHDAGYATGISGKFLNRWDPKVNPEHFDEWAIFLEGSFYNRTFNDNGQIGRVPGYTNDHVRKRLIEMLQKFEDSDEQPWFLYVGLPAAHAPFTPAPGDERAPVPSWGGNRATKERDTADKPILVSEKYDAETLRRKQLRTLLDADRLVGELRTQLEDLGELDSTLAIFVGDNGMLWGEHGLTGKRSVYTQSVNVPLMLSWPDRTEEGALDERLAANIDIAPTVLDAAGAQADWPLDGRSLLGDERRRHLLLEHWRDRESNWPSWASLITRRVQFVEYYRGGQVRGREYYDLRADPWQLRNLLGNRSRRDDPDTVQLSRQLRRMKTCRGSGCW